MNGDWLSYRHYGDQDSTQVSSVSQARESGHDRGWTHAAFIAAYGSESDNGRSLDDIVTDLQPGSVTTERERWAFRDGFHEGMEAFENEQTEGDQA